MEISAGSLSLAGSTSLLTRHERSERFAMWVGERPQEAARPRALELPADRGLGAALERAAKAKQATAVDEQLDPELEKLLLILEKVFGAKGARRFAIRLQQLHGDVQQMQQQTAQPQRAGWGLEYELHERTVEVQSASLSAEAELTLADGSTLAFRLDWSQTSVRIQQRDVRVALGDAALKDPLVLDLDGNGISFSGELARIDVDQDGRMDAVARPAGADRLVALDGAILGGRSGQAFRDLAAMDADGNGWIDAGDAVYDRLQLWDGRAFTGLAQGGVAAIATASVALPFAHRDGEGGLQAQGRRGGVFLRDDGVAGAVAQVDLVA
ncbi:MAG: hypothetical protein J0M02_08325 [Planctomycetes bacterium]|nr:hypothetical protein [Planctomycetota bacterium]